MAETTAYMYLGLGAVMLIMGGLVASITLRWQSLKRDMKTLEELEH